ncbi:GntR family transcriptional regulator [Miniphocaeibacter halophilus]|uniref:GntR family transcriptional regulator n=1 Tax=Miniphocaeibacter halophilus TaxID=2931922 RepID=A0AC61MNS0_9FIRM|nr:GntR family transcriptional regulator [Miniphocaeibacter halophilus]QQK07131.1 GntR family transcriptional regulator [Miniphocaeibacter halophilus]
MARIPKYQQIKSDLQLQIQSGKFQNGDRFYSEADLMKLYNVSSITVIRAVRELTNEGYLVRKQGVGTFVYRSRKRKLVEFSDIELFPLEKDKVEVLNIEKCHDEKILKKLELSKDESYYKITRVRTADNKPYIFHTSYIPTEYINENYKDLSYYNSIYQRFKTDFNIPMNDQLSVETNEVKFPTPENIAEILKMDVNEPTVFQIKTTRLKLNKKVVEYVETYKKWDYYKIEFSTFENDN